MTWDYTTEVTADAPYLWWRLWETVGPTAADSSGNARNGTYFGTDLAFDLYGINSNDAAGAVRFNTSGATYDAGVILNPVDGSFPTTEFTLEWVARDFTLGAGRTLVSYAEATQADEIRFVFAAGSCQLFINGSSVTLSPFSTGVPQALNVNQHYALTWRNSDGRVQLWVNGARLPGTYTVGTAAVIAGAGSLVLCQDQDSVGGGYAVADALRVTLSEFAVYSSVLSDARIRVHAAAAMASYYAYSELPSLTIDPNNPDSDITDFTTSKKVTYFQRVWDTPGSVWCYYTSSVLDPNPPSSSTVPPHSGTITNHSVVGIFNTTD